jgi:hypothetical protein|tara:strand:+ start:798 stop:1310 length:513 start_codon:yes stop_codon:yes gene_type:complete
MANEAVNMIDAPVPGQSLTGEMGSKPWESPPKYNTVEEAIDFYIGQFSKPKLLGPLLDQVEDGIAISTIVNALQSGAVMEGIHTLDVGLLVAPVLVEYLALQSEEADIKFSIGDEESDIPSPESIDALVDTLVLGESPLPMPMKADPMQEEEKMMDAPDESAGLMSKRSQ